MPAATNRHDHHSSGLPRPHPRLVRRALRSRRHVTHPVGGATLSLHNMRVMFSQCCVDFRRGNELTLAPSVQRRVTTPVRAIDIEASWLCPCGSCSGPQSKPGMTSHAVSDGRMNRSLGSASGLCIIRRERGWRRARGTRQRLRTAQSSFSQLNP